MPITLPNLDDRRFDDLVAEARALIPALAPQWTNHNPSDPGITLVELFAYLTEILIYRLNRVSDANTRAFLTLLDPGLTQTDDLAADVRQTVLALRRPDRAVTPADFVLLAQEASADVARVGFIERRNLETSPTTDAPGHLSLVILPRDGGTPSAALLKTAADYLEDRRLLTTRVHVVKVRRVAINIHLQLFVEPGAVPTEVLPRARAALKAWLDPFVGGPDGNGWPFGRAVFLSEIYGVLDKLPGVDYVEPGPVPELDAAGSGRVVATTADGATPSLLVAIKLAPDELPDNADLQFDLTAIAPGGSR